MCILDTQHQPDQFNDQLCAQHVKNKHVVIIWTATYSMSYYAHVIADPLSLKCWMIHLFLWAAIT